MTPLGSSKSDRQISTDRLPEHSSRVGVHPARDVNGENKSPASPIHPADRTSDRLPQLSTNAGSQQRIHHHINFADHLLRPVPPFDGDSHLPADPVKSSRLRRHLLHLSDETNSNIPTGSSQVTGDDKTVSAIVSPNRPKSRPSSLPESAPTMRGPPSRPAFSIRTMPGKPILSMVRRSRSRISCAVRDTNNSLPTAL